MKFKFLLEILKALIVPMHTASLHNGATQLERKREGKWDEMFRDWREWFWC